MLVPTRFTAERIEHHLGVPAERLRVVPHGIDHERMTPGDEEREPFLLYPARPWPHKNHERLLEAFALLRRERPELRLVLTGGGHEDRSYPAGVEARGLVPGDELVSLYRRAAALVFPSLYEGFAFPPLEAMACGCPVAAANSGSVGEVCGDGARLFDPDDPEAIAAAVDEVLARSRAVGRARPRPGADVQVGGIGARTRARVPRAPALTLSDTETRQPAAAAATAGERTAAALRHARATVRPRRGRGSRPG